MFKLSYCIGRVLTRVLYGHIYIICTFVVQYQNIMVKNFWLTNPLDILLYSQKQTSRSLFSSQTLFTSLIPNWRMFYYEPKKPVEVFSCSCICIPHFLYHLKCLRLRFRNLYAGRVCSRSGRCCDSARRRPVGNFF